MTMSKLSTHLKKLKKTELAMLLERLAERNHETQDFLTNYFDSPLKRISAIERKAEKFLTTATKSRGFIEDEDAFADELKYIISDLIAFDSNYPKSFELILKIWEHDNQIIPICHNGIQITDAYSTEAVDAFHYFAKKVYSPRRIKKIIDKLLMNDEYDVRKFLIEYDNHD